MKNATTPESLTAGSAIEILAGAQFGREFWVRYTVSDWEQPRLDGRGRLLFTAQSEY